MNKLEFTVIDKKTGSYPNVGEIALKEDWANHLCYCDIDCFAICEDGTLLLADDCGRSAVCPSDRFEVVLENSRDVPKKICRDNDNGIYEQEFCPMCNKRLFPNEEYCSKCGQKLDWSGEK